MALPRLLVSRLTLDSVNAVFGDIARRIQNLTTAGLLPSTALDIPNVPANLSFASPDAATATKGAPVFRALTKSDLSAACPRTAFTPTFTPGAGTLTGFASACHYSIVGKDLSITGVVTGGTLSLATAFIDMPVPNSYTLDAVNIYNVIEAKDGAGAWRTVTALSQASATAIRFYADLDAAGGLNWGVGAGLFNMRFSLKAYVL